MAEFNVTINELVMKANSLSELNSQFKNQVGNLTELEGSLNGMWEGAAKNAFHNSFTADLNQMGVFYQTVEKYVATLLAAAKRYQDTELQNVEIARSRKYH